MKFTFGDIVVVEEDQIGVVVKSWLTKDELSHEVYVRSYNAIETYREGLIQWYLVRHKELSEEEKEYQYNATHDL